MLLHYPECNLKNVFLVNYKMLGKDNSVYIPNINLLHMEIARKLIYKRTRLTSEEFTFLLDEYMESLYEYNLLSEYNFRQQVLSELQTRGLATTKEIRERWCRAVSVDERIIIDASNPSKYVAIFDRDDYHEICDDIRRILEQKENLKTDISRMRITTISNARNIGSIYTLLNEIEKDLNHLVMHLGYMTDDIYWSLPNAERTSIETTADTDLRAPELKS